MAVRSAAQKAAQKKAAIASARKRRKGFKKIGTIARTTGAKRSANKSLRKFGVSKARQMNKQARLSKRARRASVRATAAKSKASTLQSKANRAHAKYSNVKNGKPIKKKNVFTQFQKKRKIAKAHVKRYRGQ